MLKLGSVSQCNGTLPTLSRERHSISATRSPLLPLDRRAFELGASHPPAFPACTGT